MSFEAYFGFTGDTATIYLSGDLTDKRVPAVRTLIDQALSRPVNRLVLRMHGLTSLSAAGVRCLCCTQQQLPAGAQIVVDGACDRVRRVLQASGFAQAVTLIEGSLSLPDEPAAA
ncbi:STAS domain-containing protein [Streptomyces sp. AN091965]|uniref:STAS domain-containing protein n=1 Tax=Streptomyces sp. AN091965 TaxID=2927803 RepID=UPI001F612B4D|nr:STAS domain-containing protein [Streptomyces sp. AN091965]MCI3927789.1 STAS domain-containing protein [Streptomyces sp. AN091965]